MPDAPVVHRSSIRRARIHAVWYPWNGMSWLSPAVNVATLHDASVFSLAPGDAVRAEQEQRPFRLAARQAQRIITDSHFAKAELMRHLALDPARVDVVHLGVDGVFNASTARRPEQQPGRRFILFVGEPEPRKDLRVLLQAVETLPDQLRTSLEVVLAGASGSYALPPVPPGVRVRSVGRVGDEELAALYAGASLLAHPSQYEGFGLPVLEAMAAGTPVVASDIPSVREAAGDAAEFVKPGDAAAFSYSLQRVLTDTALAADLRSRGTAHAATKSWDRTAEQTLHSIRRAVAESGE